MMGCASRSASATLAIEQDERIVLCGNKAAPPPERCSLGVNRVDDQRATCDEVCGRDAALQCIFEQAGADYLQSKMDLKPRMGRVVEIMY